MQSQFCRQRGLTLIEVAIGLIIIGILMAGALAIYRVQQHARAAEATARNLETIEEALGTFVSRFGHYPVPMAFAVVEGEANYGRASALAGACNAGPPSDNRICRGAGAGGTVLVGSLPFHDLNLPADKTIDGYGRRFTYAVTEMMTVPETETVPWVPAVCVRQQQIDASGNIVTLDCTPPDNPPQDMAIISHGRDGHGGWTPDGRPYINCGTDGPRAQDANCDNDGSFLQPASRFEGDSADYNDDVVSVDVLPDSNHWQDSAEGIYNRGEQFVGIGLDNPEAALDVAGNIKANRLRATELCSREGDNAENCFGPEKIAGNDPQMRCGDAGFVSGLDHGQVRCQGLMHAFNCPPDEPLTGINADGSPICGTPDACTETYEEETVACPSGETGEITRRRDFQCPADGTGEGSWTAWAQTGTTCAATPAVCRTYTVLMHNSFNPTWEPRDVGAECPANFYAHQSDLSATACIGPPVSCAGQPTWQEAIAQTRDFNCRAMQTGMTYATDCPEVTGLPEETACDNDPSDGLASGAKYCNNVRAGGARAMMQIWCTYWEQPTGGGYKNSYDCAPLAGQCQSGRIVIRGRAGNTEAACNASIGAQQCGTPTGRDANGCFDYYDCVCIP